MKPNQAIRDYARARGVTQWQIAERIGVSEQTVFRRFCTPLSSEQKGEILAAIDFIAAEMIANAGTCTERIKIKKED